MRTGLDMTKKIALLLLLGGIVLLAHPMGNFSISHYMKLIPVSNGIQMRYSLDLAEIPTFELLREWKLERESPRAELDRQATAQPRKWIKNLRMLANRHPCTPKLPPPI